MGLTTDLHEHFVSLEWQIKRLRLATLLPLTLPAFLEWRQHQNFATTVITTKLPPKKFQPRFTRELDLIKIPNPAHARAQSPVFPLGRIPFMTFNTPTQMGAAGRLLCACFRSKIRGGMTGRWRYPLRQGHFNFNSILY